MGSDTDGGAEVSMCNVGLRGGVDGGVAGVIFPRPKLQQPLLLCIPPAILIALFDSIASTAGSL